MGNRIRIEQALHGYANGHQLISASLELKVEDRCRMDELSDLSGKCNDKDFTDYYTGYPLLNENKYVIARTWYAYEQQRPGCVWTHSLIVDMNDLHKIGNIKKFMSLFHKPGENENYSQSIFYLPDDEENINNYDMEKLKYVIYTVFSDHKYKYIFSDGSKYDEQLLFVIKLMPCELLEKFTFCTMSYDIRKMGEKEFDYQITSLDNMYNIERNLKERHICEDIINIETYPLWVTEYCKCIENGSLIDLHNFIRQYGNEYMNMANYSAMVRLYFAAINSHELTLGRFFEYIGQVLKTEATGFDTKTVELILDEEFLPNIFMDKREMEIWDMFDLGKVKLDKKYKKKLNTRTLKKSPENIYILLQKYIYGKLREHTKAEVENLILQLSPDQLNAVSNMDENICVVLVSINKRLILSRDIWMQKKEFQQMLLAAGTENISENDLRKLVLTIVEYDRENITENLYNIYGNTILPFVYEAIEKNLKKKNTGLEYWFPILLKNEEMLMNNLYIFYGTDWAKKLFLQINTYRDELIFGVTREKWREIYNKIALDNKLNFKIAIQFLPIALKTDYFSKEIYTIAYPIYQLLKKNEMPFDEWNKVQSLLPSVEQCYMWDKCLRVRKALMERGYSIEGFLKDDGS